MQDPKRGSHTVWDCKYHLVWVTKYRFPILGGDVGQRARELLREIARANEMTIYAGAINRDHVHMLISIPPQMSRSSDGALRGREHIAARSLHGLGSTQSSSLFQIMLGICSSLLDP
jgi:putative transposase